MLLMRDSYLIPINKYLFVGLIGVVVIFSNYSNTMLLLSFLMPLYVGLPGNYISLIILLKCLISQKRQNQYIKSNIGGTIFVFLLCFFVFIQSSSSGESQWISSFFNYAIGLVVVYCIFVNKKVDLNQMCLSYLFGVAALGVIMLLSTLNQYDVDTLMSSASRLGSSSVDYVDESQMSINIDPNYYGMFAIAALSLNFPQLIDKNLKKIEVVMTIVSLLAVVIVALIGLSRSFILLLVLWIVLFLLKGKRIKSIVTTSLVILFVFAFVSIALPNVIDALIERFQGDDITTGNGRLTLIDYYTKKWLESPQNLFFGLGFLKCNVHCMPLQFIFGGGVCLTILMFSFCCYLYNNPKVICAKQMKQTRLPLLVIFISSCTVPIAILVNFMYPLFLALLVAKKRSC